MSARGNGFCGRCGSALRLRTQASTVVCEGCGKSHTLDEGACDDCEDAFVACDDECARDGDVDGARAASRRVWVAFSTSARARRRKVPMRDS